MLFFFYGDWKRPGGRASSCSTSQGPSPRLSYAMFHYKWCLGTGFHPLWSLRTHVCTRLHTSYKKSNWTTMGTLWNFNLLRGHGMLLLIPFPSTLTSLRLTGQLPSFQKEHCCRVFWLFEIVWFHTLQYSNHPRWVCQISWCHLHSVQILSWGKHITSVCMDAKHRVGFL